MNINLEKKYIQELKAIMGSFPEIKRASIYGSRALNNNKKTSDIDLVIYGEQINHSTKNKLKDKLENESNIPYFFDITHYESVSNEELKKHIDKFSINI